MTVGPSRQSLRAGASDRRRALTPTPDGRPPALRTIADHRRGEAGRSPRDGWVDRTSTARAIAAATVVVAGLVAAAGCVGAGLFEAVVLGVP